MNASQQNILDQIQIHKEADRYVIQAQIAWTVNVDQQQAPDQLQRQVEQVGQQIKREIYASLLQQVEQQIANQFQLANPKLQRRGSRPYTLVTLFGKVPIQRTRLFDPVDKTWSVPAQLVWDSPHRTWLLPGLQEAVCQNVQNLSVRNTAQTLSQQAGVNKLLAPSTVINLFHEEGRQGEQTQREVLQALPDQHPQAVECGLAGPQDDPPPEEEEPEAPLPELTEEEQQEVRQRAIGFFLPDSAEFQEALGEDNSADEGSMCDAAPTEEAPPAGETTRETPGEANDVLADRPHSPRRVDDGWVMLQPDEVQTKAQASEEGKRNLTYTATVDVEDRTYYLAAGCASMLWGLAAFLLSRLGVLDGTRGLLVVGDGASWIRNWYEQVVLPKQEMVLCWYHLTKRVYERLSQGGFSKSRRQEIEHQVLGHLWRGELSEAVCFLWSIREEARQSPWITQLIRYLLRRRDYLPNYSARHADGLWIASTRVEKWNDLAVSDRCKRRGMSWTAEGVLAIALHAAEQRNGPHLWDAASQPVQAV